MRLSLCNEVLRPWPFERLCAVSAALGRDGAKSAPFRPAGPSTGPIDAATCAMLGILVPADGGQAGRRAPDGPAGSDLASASPSTRCVPPRPLPSRPAAPDRTSCPGTRPEPDAGAVPAARPAPFA